MLNNMGGVCYKKSPHKLLRRKQYRMADSLPDCTKLSSRFIIGKLSNCRSVVRRYESDYPDLAKRNDSKHVRNELASGIIRLSKTQSLEEVRGIEGEMARLYFSFFDHMILTHKDSFYMTGRTRRPPLDKVNALLSFFYTLLSHETKSALETVGLDPYVGFLHWDRPGRASLSLDLMEEFRPYMVDRLVLSLINRKQISSEDFITKVSGGVILLPRWPYDNLGANIMFTGFS